MDVLGEGLFRRSWLLVGWINKMKKARNLSISLFLSPRVSISREQGARVCQRQRVCCLLFGLVWGLLCYGYGFVAVHRYHAHSKRHW